MICARVSWFVAFPFLRNCLKAVVVCIKAVIKCEVNAAAQKANSRVVIVVRPLTESERRQSQRPFKIKPNTTLDVLTAGDLRDLDDAFEEGI